VEYSCLTLQISPSEPFTDLITFRLGEIGFEMFEDQPGGMKAFIKAEQFDETEIRSIIEECTGLGAEISYKIELIPWQNWNETWEKNFSPEVISNRIYIRAGFHPPAPEYPIELIVEPRMAFGTGHHPTTRQMMEQMLLLDFNDKSVLDMGCGTGILALLAGKLGATKLTAIDYDPNSVEITIENARLNNVEGVHTLLGEADKIHGDYDLVLANINRNIILNDLPAYKAAMHSGSLLLTSGYYLDDLDAIRSEAEFHGLQYVHHSEQDNWCCALFLKP
jgi:ribosomal protein L11 methyltransferase